MCRKLRFVLYGATETTHCMYAFSLCIEKVWLCEAHAVTGLNPSQVDNSLRFLFVLLQYYKVESFMLYNMKHGELYTCERDH